jgi:hypothetical protein
VIEFAVAIAVRIINPVVNPPELVGLGIDLDTGPPPDAFDHGLGIVTVLMTHQLNGKGAILVQDRIIKHHIPAWGEDELLPYVVPHPAV